MNQFYVTRDESGAVSRLTRWPSEAGQERLPENHTDVVGYRVGGAKNRALAEVKALAQALVADLDSSITKSAARDAVLPFKTQFQGASTEAEVEAVRVAAIAAIEAL
ncbi:MAG: hypothetical protein V3V24_09760 [Nitrospinaceae bacterium]